MNYTPGPWRYDIAMKNIGLAFIESETTNEQICEFHREEINIEANAKLIAAGPTMYEYIKKKAEQGDIEAKGIINSL